MNSRSLSILLGLLVVFFTGVHAVQDDDQSTEIDSSYHAIDARLDRSTIMSLVLTGDKVWTIN